MKTLNFKKILIFFFLAALPLSGYSQQKEYTGFLEQALEAVENFDQESFTTNLTYFAVALERDKITPESLTKENLELYTKCLFNVLAYTDFELSEKIGDQALTFINYNLESTPRNLFAMGKFYAEGIVVSQDYDKAMYWYEKAAEKGETAAMTNLGMMYYRGSGVTQDYAKARQWFEEAVEQGNSVSMSNLGVMYENGHGVPQDYKKAIEWYKKAAEKNEPVAMDNLGTVYEIGEIVAQDYKEAVEWYRKAAEKGYADSMNNLGRMYKNGYGVAQDYQKAKYWYEKATEKKHAGAMNNLGVLYHYGQGVSKDYQKAKSWYDRAAEKGSEYAMYNIGELYYFGNGVSKDYQEAKKWYEKSAEQGYEEAMFSIGILYDFCEGVNCDWNKAAEWYRRAAELDHPVSLRKLGEFYYFGVGGVQKNEKSALEYFSKAVELGDEKAGTYLQAIEDIKNKKYHILNTSNYGNRIYINDEVLEYHKNEMPWVISKFGVGWSFDVHYEKNSEGTVQIFPQYAYNTADRPVDFVQFSNFSSSSPMAEPTGNHEYSISFKLDRGNRAIGYTYIIAHFPNGEDLRIKVPVAICWKPSNEY